MIAVYLMSFAACDRRLGMLTSPWNMFHGLAIKDSERHLAGVD